MLNSPSILVFGSNNCGQAGVANGEDFIPTPVENHLSYLDSSMVSRIIAGQRQSFAILIDGSILSCGENDKGELARQGKRSLFQRVDSLEAYSVVDIACGDGYFLLACNDGKLIGWGNNDLGQLGCGDRIVREKPKVNSSMTEGILQIVSGAQHVFALTKSGNVISWGGNRKGQLGDGQMTSSTIPLTLSMLRHRPVISLACGESHSMALTIGGSIFVWGENAQGQLGLGDTTPRLRAELIRSLRAAKAVKISCGRQHSAVISKSGLLFTFGSNSFGQLGIGEFDSRIVKSPTVVERLRDFRTVDVCCGSGHTLVLSSAETGTRVYAMGLNTSGQVSSPDSLSHSSESYNHLPAL
jgi:alpha-tubulin suppressor-like RCC1 family protein